MPDQSEIERDLQTLAAELRRLEAEYNMFFAGRLPRPPWETRSRVEALIKRWDRGRIDTSADRFRFGSLQHRYALFAELWDRGLRAREEGRPGPFAHRPATRPREDERTRVLYVAAFNDPVREIDKLCDLYDALMDARRDAGEETVPFPNFANLVKEHVSRYRRKGSDQVAFRVALQDGKVKFTVKG